MIGLSMLLLSFIFGGAVLFRKKFFNTVVDAVSSRVKDSTAGSVHKMLKTVRNIGLADAAIDWMDLRGSKKKEVIDRINNLKPTPPNPDGHRKVDVGGMRPEVSDPEGPEVWEGQPPAGGIPKELPGDTLKDTEYWDVPEGTVKQDTQDTDTNDIWEGQPPDGYPFKELPAGKTNEGSPVTKPKKFQGVSIDNTKTIPVQSSKTAVHSSSNTPTKVTTEVNQILNPARKGEDGNSSSSPTIVFGDPGAQAPWQNDGGNNIQPTPPVEKPMATNTIPVMKQDQDKFLSQKNNTSLEFEIIPTEDKDKKENDNSQETLHL